MTLSPQPRQKLRPRQILLLDKLAEHLADHACHSQSTSGGSEPLACLFVAGNDEEQFQCLMEEDFAARTLRVTAE